jgi:hypothetical protein
VHCTGFDAACCARRAYVAGPARAYYESFGLGARSETPSPACSTCHEPRIPWREAGYSPHPCPPLNPLSTPSPCPPLHKHGGAAGGGAALQRREAQRRLEPLPLQQPTLDPHPTTPPPGGSICEQGLADEGRGTLWRGRGPCGAPGWAARRLANPPATPTPQNSCLPCWHSGAAPGQPGAPWGGLAWLAGAHMSAATRLAARRCVVGGWRPTSHTSDCAAHGTQYGRCLLSAAGLEWRGLLA